MTAISTHEPGVVRATRLEIVDEAGRVHAVLGPLATPDPRTPVHGLALVDEGGRARVWLALDATGPNLVFDLLGNNLVSLGVNDPTADALHVGAYLHMTDMDGAPVLDWQVEEDGTVFARYGGTAR